MLATAAHYLPYNSPNIKYLYLDMEAATYLHLGMKAATMMAPESPNPHPLNSASVIEVSMVTGLQSKRSPLNVKSDKPC
jgi:hypothetical protein